MRVAVVNTHVPFTMGGAEAHADNLVKALEDCGHEVELVKIPFNWQSPWSVMDHLLATRMFDLERVNGKVIDRVIGLRFPAYHVRHPNKVLWIIHQYRSAFDFWEDPKADLAQQEGGRAVRDAIRSSERKLLAEAKAIYANSDNVRKRLHDFCLREAETLYHPPALADVLKPGEDSGYFLCPGRLDSMKRQDFVLQALAKCKQSISLKFVGSTGSEKYAKDLIQSARRLKVADCIEWCGYVSKEELSELYAHARAIVYAPQDEDYGYVALESQIAAKPVLTTDDSGGVLEFVNDSNGWVASFNPEQFAENLDEAWSDPDKCKRLGEAGNAAYRSHDMTWAAVVDRLVS
ncbi:MAG: glycosyltransferase family 4 protein [Opitutales bacterium]